MSKSKNFSIAFVNSLILLPTHIPDRFCFKIFQGVFWDAITGVPCARASKITFPKFSIYENAGQIQSTHNNVPFIHPLRPPMRLTDSNSGADSTWKRYSQSLFAGQVGVFHLAQVQFSQAET